MNENICQKCFRHLFVSAQKFLLHLTRTNIANPQRKIRDLFVEMITASMKCECLRIWTGTVLSSDNRIVFLLSMSIECQLILHKVNYFPNADGDKYDGHSCQGMKIFTPEKT